MYFLVLIRTFAILLFSVEMLFNFFKAVEILKKKFLESQRLLRFFNSNDIFMQAR